MSQGKKTQRARAQTTINVLRGELEHTRSQLAETAIEVNTGRVLDAAVKNLCKMPQYSGLGYDIDIEINRLIEPLRNQDNGQEDKQEADIDAAPRSEGAEAVRIPISEGVEAQAYPAAGRVSSGRDSDEAGPAGDAPEACHHCGRAHEPAEGCCI